MDKPCFWLAAPQGDGTSFRFATHDIPTVFAWIVRHNAIVEKITSDKIANGTTAVTIG